MKGSYIGVAIGEGVLQGLLTGILGVWIMGHTSC